MSTGGVYLFYKPSAPVFGSGSKTNLLVSIGVDDLQAGTSSRFRKGWEYILGQLNTNQEGKIHEQSLGNLTHHVFRDIEDPTENTDVKTFKNDNNKKKYFARNIYIEINSE